MTKPQTKRSGSSPKEVPVNKWENKVTYKFKVTSVVTVAEFYHRGGNGPTTAGGVICVYLYI